MRGSAHRIAVEGLLSAAAHVHAAAAGSLKSRNELVTTARASGRARTRSGQLPRQASGPTMGAGRLSHVSCWPRADLVCRAFSSCGLGRFSSHALRPRLGHFLFCFASAYTGSFTASSQALCITHTRWIIVIVIVLFGGRLRYPTRRAPFTLTRARRTPRDADWRDADPYTRAVTQICREASSGRVPRAA